MCKMVSYNDLVKELSKIGIQLSEYNSKIELARMNYNNSPKWLKWFYKIDIDDFTSIHSNLLYRYKVLKSIKENFYKFVCGITMSEFKDTRKLVLLLDRLKLVEAIDILHIQLEDNNLALKDLKVQVRRIETKVNANDKVS